MNEHFETKLAELSRLADRHITAKEEAAGELTPELEEVREEASWRLEGYARQRQFSFRDSTEGKAVRHGQKQVYMLQMEKQRVMRALHQELAALDDPSHESPMNPESVLVYKKGETYKTASGEELTVGDIVTGHEWGIDYHLDPLSVPKSVRKRLLVEKAKTELRELLDWQIYFDEVPSNRVHDMTKQAYEAMRARWEGSAPEQAGIVIERIVRLFFKKLAYDCGLDLQVAETDAFDDVVKKVDFIIRRTGRYRGVKVETDQEEKAGAVGIQFTVNQNSIDLERKRGQVERSRSRLTGNESVQDIVLVLLSSPLAHSIHKAYTNWHGNRAASGPDSWWSTDLKEAVFRGVLNGVFTPEEIDEQWKKVAGFARA